MDQRHPHKSKLDQGKVTFVDKEMHFIRSVETTFWLKTRVKIRDIGFDVGIGIGLNLGI